VLIIRNCTITFCEGKNGNICLNKILFEQPILNFRVCFILNPFFVGVLEENYLDWNLKELEFGEGGGSNPAKYVLLHPPNWFFFLTYIF
jgi:hypothetical protein